jgi:hypothetical protein
MGKALLDKRQRRTLGLPPVTSIQILLLRPYQALEIQELKREVQESART